MVKWIKWESGTPPALWELELPPLGGIEIQTWKRDEELYYSIFWYAPAGSVNNRWTIPATQLFQVTPEGLQQAKEYAEEFARQLLTESLAKLDS